MISRDDPEVIESLKYLLVPKSERIRYQAMPFDGKKQCFIPDHKEGFIPAEITGKEGSLITVKTTKGEVNSFKIILSNALITLCMQNKNFQRLKKLKKTISSK